MKNLKKIRIIKDWKKQLKSYSFLSIAANFLTALSVSGLAVMGILATQVAFHVLLIIVIPLGLFGLIGRFIDQAIEDDGGD